MQIQSLFSKPLKNTPSMPRTYAKKSSNEKVKETKFCALCSAPQLRIMNRLEKKENPL
jgi:hypothetical protein